MPGVVSVIAWKRSPPCTAVTALPTVVPPDAVVSVKLSARLPSVPTPLLPLASPLTVVADVVTRRADRVRRRQRRRERDAAARGADARAGRVRRASAAARP